MLVSLYRFLVEDCSRLVWSFWVLPCVLVGGVWFTLRTCGMHVLRFFTVMGECVKNLFSGRKTESGVSPMEALCTALAGTVGTGSVVGSCQAIALGGAGALFWLWVAAFFGMIIKFCEVTLAIRFRKRGKDGEWLGGPMYYMTEGMGEHFRPLAASYALFALLASFGMGCLAQANSVSVGVKSLSAPFVFLSPRGEGFLAVGVAVVLGVALAMALKGGMRRVGRMASLLVPLMSLLFVGVCLTVLVVYRHRLPRVLSEVFSSAFGCRSLLGAGSGIAMKTALEWGLKRSAFSNEAGLGSAAIAHAAAETDDPVRQGFFGIFEVFVDTLVICSLTGLVILAALPSAEVTASAADATLIVRGVASVFGDGFASVFVGGSLALFAFSTLLGWSVYGARSARYLFGSGAESAYRILFALCAAVGAILAVEPVWALSDLFNGLMAIPNFIALFALSGEVKKLTLAYFLKRKEEKHKKV